MITYTTNADAGTDAVAVGDVNGDYQLDLIVANYDASNIGILLGDGTGAFGVQTTYLTGSSSDPYYIAVVDLNKDNRLDIVVANGGTDNVGVLLGNGDGTFQTQTPFSTGTSSEPSSIAIGDLNNDNSLDLVVVNYKANNIGVLLGYGNGTFQAQKIYSTGSSSGPVTVGVYDFTGDGNLDIAVANFDGNNVGVFLANGNGTFKSQMTLSIGAHSRPSWIVVGDFNEDTKVDIAVANYMKSSVDVLVGVGNGSFIAQTTFSIGKGSGTNSIEVADFNGDGHLDVTVANYKAATLCVLLGIGNGTFARQMIFSTGSKSKPTVVAVNDFNNDNQLDIVVTNSNRGNVGILLNTC
jgi:hypothetical protein